MKSRTRVLFIAEAVTLAHVARAHSLAESLDPDRFEVCLAADPRYASLFGSHGYATRTVATIATDRFAAAIAKGSPIYDVETLAAYVADDLRVIGEFAPDVVVGDFRLSLSVSARLAATPYVTVTNAGWSPYADVRFTVPDLPINRWFGVPVAQRLFDLARPIAFAAHARPLNRLRRRHGLPPLAADIRAAYTDADSILYADLPELFSMRAMPQSHAFLGPVQWSPTVTLPDWWQRLPEDRPVVYATLGSSGLKSVLPTLIDALASAPVSLVVATAGRVALDAVPANVFVSNYLPGSDAASRALLVVCNGGSPTCYQAFEHGTPVIGIPTNLDQYLNMAAVVASGAGAMVRPSAADARSLRRRVDTVLNEPSYREHAQRLAIACKSRDPAARLTEALDAAVAGARGAPATRQAAGARDAVTAALAR